ncbi:hypothetical protein [Streptomyces venezuelae]|uniref:hypothetical protein n=1 Tax=Streptomyces venezuelae TaxID=54571 RepID=UPI00123A16DB|nr:hypothetical protein [Streptomyces venezuelae]
MTDRPAPADRSRLLAWARDLYIAADPDLAARHQHALGQLEDADPEVSRAAVDELSAILHDAIDAVGGQPQHRGWANDRRSRRGRPGALERQIRGRQPMSSSLSCRPTLEQPTNIRPLRLRATHA